MWNYLDDAVNVICARAHIIAVARNDMPHIVSWGIPDVPALSISVGGHLKTFDRKLVSH